MLWFECVLRSSCIGNLILHVALVGGGAKWELFGSWKHLPHKWFIATVAFVGFS